MRAILKFFVALFLVWSRCCDAAYVLSPTCSAVADPDHYIPCSIIKCCDDANAYPWFATWAARFGHASDLARELSTGHPLANLTTLNSKPLNVEVIMDHPILIKLHLEVFRISDINQRAQSFKMHYILVWMWRDCRLTFNSTADCMHTITLDQDNTLFHSFWRPLSRIAERENDVESMRLFRHMIHAYGMDTFTEERVSYFRCSFDFTDMPFDKQTCVLTILLPVHSARQYQLSWAGLTISKITNAEWKIQTGEEWKTSRMWQIVHGLNTSILRLEFNIERRSKYLVNSYLAPAVLFYCLSWVGLWIDANAVPARAAVGIIPILILTNNVNSLRSSLPPISYDTRLSKFLTLTVVFTVIHMLEYGVVQYMSRRVKFFDDCKDKYEIIPVAVQPHMEVDVSVEQPIKVASRRCTRLKIKFVRNLHTNLYSYTRILSILGYVLGAIMCLAVE